MMRSIWKVVCHHSMQRLTHIISVRSIFDKKHFINPLLIKDYSQPICTSYPFTGRINALHPSYTPQGSEFDSRFDFSKLQHTDTDTTIVQWYERSEVRYTTRLARCSTHIDSVHSMFVIMMGEDEKNLDANQMRAMNKYLFISHRRSEPIFIVFILYSISTVNVSCVLVFVNKYLVK